MKKIMRILTIISDQYAVIQMLPGVNARSPTSNTLCVFDSPGDPDAPEGIGKQNYMTQHIVK